MEPIPIGSRVRVLTWGEEPITGTLVAIFDNVASGNYRVAPDDTTDTDYYDVYRSSLEVIGELSE